MNHILQAMQSASSRFIDDVCVAVNKKNINPCYYQIPITQNSLSIINYDSLTTEQIRLIILNLSPLELRKLRSYELLNQCRKLILTTITNELTHKVFEEI